MKTNNVISIIVFIALVSFCFLVFLQNKPDYIHTVRRDTSWTEMQDTFVFKVNDLSIDIPYLPVEVNSRSNRKVTYILKNRSAFYRKLVFKNINNRLELALTDSIKAERRYYNSFRIETGTFQSLTAGEHANVKLYLPSWENKTKLKLHCKKNAELELFYLDTDTLHITSKCNSKIVLHSCKVKHLIHHTEGGSLFTGNSKIKHADIVNIQRGRCISNITVSALQVNADLAHDPYLSFAFKSWYTPQLKNIERSNVYKILK